MWSVLWCLLIMSIITDYQVSFDIILVVIVSILSTFTAHVILILHFVWWSGNDNLAEIWENYENLETVSVL